MAFPQVIGAAGLVAAAGANVATSGAFHPWYYRLLRIGKPAPPIGGRADPGFESVEAAFRGNFENGLEVGAAVTVFSRGVKAVELHGGHSDQDRRHAFSEQTLQSVFSVSKVMVRHSRSRLTL